MRDQQVFLWCMTESARRAASHKMLEVYIWPEYRDEVATYRTVLRTLITEQGCHISDGEVSAYHTMYSHKRTMSTSVQLVLVQEGPHTLMAYVLDSLVSRRLLESGGPFLKGDPTYTMQMLTRA